jgi:chromosomal replication initiator protein
VADVNSDLVPVWARVVERLAGDADVRDEDTAWLWRIQPMWMMHDTALLTAPNEFAKQALEGRLLPRLTDALSQEFCGPVRIAVMVDANAEDWPAQGYHPEEPLFPERAYAVEPARDARPYEQPYEQGYPQCDRHDFSGYQQRPTPYDEEPPAWPAHPGPVPSFRPDSQRHARPLAALSDCPPRRASGILARATQYEDNPPPCDRPRLTPLADPAGNSEQALGGSNGPRRPAAANLRP